MMSSAAPMGFEDKTIETGTFQISYVKALEQRVQQLEEQLRVCQAQYDQMFFQNSSPTMVRGIENVPTSSVSPNSLNHESTSGVPLYGLSPYVSATEEKKIESGAEKHAHDDIPESLESGMKLLSLEATAERYLGSSSGVAFARLTQAVLKRLKPDIQNFSVEKQVEFQSTTDTPSEARGEGREQPTPKETDLASKIMASQNLLPAKELAHQLAEYYWLHSHTLYPFLRKGAFMSNLKKMYEPEELSIHSNASWLYTMWMVFAIGSTSLSSIMVTDETKSVEYFNAAMLYFDDTLGEGNMAALKAIMLQVSYSFFNQVGPRMAIRLALGTGLHTNPSKSVDPFPVHVQQYRSRIFYSIYMMDRLVSVTLGRPFGIRDEDIEIEPFAAADDGDILPDRINPHSKLSLPSTAIPLHIVSLRKLEGEIFQEIYSNKNRHLSATERDTIIRNLHERLVAWRRNMPFPLPESQALHVPQLSTTWFDLNYHTHVIVLYRPSPLCPSITLEKVTILADAAAMSIRHVATLHRQQRFAFNWLNLFTFFSSTLALIYTITAQPEPIPAYLERSDGLSDLRLAANILQTFGEKIPSALRYRKMVLEVILRLESHIKPQQPTNTDTSTTEKVQHPDPSYDITQSLLCETFNSQADNQGPWPITDLDGMDTEINMLSSNQNLPLALQLFEETDLFNDFTGMDFATGFDVIDSMEPQNETLKYF
ncbi:hypothetical protein PVAG01_03983 [Phlyctema vagabunda]|uniref:Xylanolytic transcriptional activator regulatory domain-containing protein n=1 Tax=Phlyctema vagabunda TaxID=108571 RepID=A0ABR4PNN4_9HELO